VDSQYQISSKTVQLFLRRNAQTCRDYFG